METIMDIYHCCWGEKNHPHGGEQPLPLGGVLGPYPYNSETLTDPE